jgi:hypothetical protein
VDNGLLTKTKINDFFYTLAVNTKHKLAETLLETAGISRERFSFPVVSFYRSDLLISQEQVPEIMEPSSLDRLEPKVQRDAPDWFPLWVKLLEDSSGLLPVADGTAYEETSLLVVNSGAHWNKATLGGDIEEEEFVAGYRNMVNAPTPTLGKKTLIL